MDFDVGAREIVAMDVEYASIALYILVSYAGVSTPSQPKDSNSRLLCEAGERNAFAQNKAGAALPSKNLHPHIVRIKNNA